MRSFLNWIAEVELPWGKSIITAIMLWCLAFCSAAENHKEKFENLVRADALSYYQSLGHSIDSIEITSKLPARLHASKCNDMHINRFPEKATPLKKVRYEIDCEDGQTHRGYAIIKLWTKAIVSTRQINVGESIDESVLTTRSIDISRLRGGFTTNLQEVVGYRVKRKIKQHQAITFMYLTAPDLVTKGEIVTLQAQGNGFVASTKAQSLQDGKLGERIKVRNLSSNKIIQAQVIGKNLLKSEN